MSLLRIILLSGLSLLLCTPIHAQANIRAQVSDTLAELGQRVQVFVEAESQDGFQLSTLPIPRQWGAWEVLNDSFPKISGTKQLAFTLDLIQFDSGRFQVPPIPVLVQGKGKTDTLFSGAMSVHVKPTQLREGDKFKPLKDLLGGFGKISDYWQWLLVGPLVIGLSILGWIWMLRRKRKRDLASQNPWVQQLKALQNRNLSSPQALKDHYTELADILRRGIHETYSAPTFEQTSAEILNRFGNTHNKLRNSLRPILENADLVKFAKAFPDKAMQNADLDQAIDWAASYLVAQAITPKSK